MAASPRWEVYDAHGVYQGAVKEVEAAASLIAGLYCGGTIRDRHARIVWRDLVDGDTAESYDVVAHTVAARTRVLCRDQLRFAWGLQ